jgi:hypothetical protein
MTETFTAAQKMAYAIKRAELAHAYTAAVLDDIKAAAAALEDAVTMPKAVADAADVLIGEFLWVDYEPRMIYFEGEGDDGTEYGEEMRREGDKLEAARAIYVDWRAAHEAAADAANVPEGKDGWEEFQPTFPFGN